MILWVHVGTNKLGMNINDVFWGFSIRIVGRIQQLFRCRSLAWRSGMERVQPGRKVLKVKKVPIYGALHSMYYIIYIYVIEI